MKEDLKRDPCANEQIGTGAANTTREQNINLHRPPKLGNVQMRILQREPSTKLSVKTDTAEPEPLPDEQTIKAVVQAYQKCLAAYELFRYARVSTLFTVHETDGSLCLEV